MWDAFRNLHSEFHEKMEQMQRLGGLRVLILHVLDENGPGNGVEIMDAIQAHQESCTMHYPGHGPSRKHYRPSPGSVYPMLKKMVIEELLIKREDGKYELTGKGKKILEKLYGRFKPHEKMDRGEYSITRALTEIEGYVSYLEDIKEEKLAPHGELIGELSQRLEAIKNSIQKE